MDNKDNLTYVSIIYKIYENHCGYWKKMNEEIYQFIVYHPRSPLAIVMSLLRLQ